MTTTIGDQDLGFTAMADLRAGRTYRGKNFMAKMTTELKELILVLCEDPTELVLTCQSFHRLAALSVIRSRFVKRQFGPWCDIFALSCFSPFDAYVLDCFDPFSACGERRFRRLLRFVKSGEVLDQILNLAIQETSSILCLGRPPLKASFKFFREDLNLSGTIIKHSIKLFDQTRYTSPTSFCSFITENSCSTSQSKPMLPSIKACNG
ncbi:hypothetical protein DFJ73DRAFT_164680 [Zopfochytrium polystomum]|nr:hypothetical protein DFJ73DRAFT_164680 [Zopfochytrium polystomum]